MTRSKFRNESPYFAISYAQEFFPLANGSSSKNTAVDNKVHTILPGIHGSESSHMKPSAASLSSFLPQQYALPLAKIIPFDWQLVLTICLIPSNLLLQNSLLSICRFCWLSQTKCMISFIRIVHRINYKQHPHI